MMGEKDGVKETDELRSKEKNEGEKRHWRDGDE